MLTIAGEPDEALATADEAVTRAAENKYFWCLPEMLLIKGEVLRAASPENVSRAERQFQMSVDWARRQGALAWELRVATSLARLWQEQDRSADALALLQPIYARFTEGLDTADLRTAEELLIALRDELDGNAAL